MKRYQSKLDPVISSKLKSSSKGQVPVIIRFKSNNMKTYNKIAFNMSDKVKYNLPVVRGLACKMDIDEINMISKDPNIEYISFDSKVFALMDIASKSVSVDFPVEQGFSGNDVTVAVIDTGVAPHSDFTKPNNRIIGFKDFINDKSTPYDDNGHGTHVCGIIAANGYSSNGKYSGIAPEANILAVKALDESGSGNTSDIVSAIFIKIRPSKL
ncbi:S8 family serine peptidase [Clostridiisalibacter paucivorans]|uniref:S8 family serine peptidase n=1 Tax=Clostridiisalibacter paucivorans TaxID=408753 RepID=UPI0024DE71F9|nr:S8 family serine peptidase [Clostridiisalibacter paucivorans]